jgi:hypothetical protein
MQLDPQSVRAGFRAGLRAAQAQMMDELDAARAEIAAKRDALRAEIAAKCDALHRELEQTRLEFANYKAGVTHDRAQLAEVNRLRMLVVAQCAQRDPTTPLQ